MDYLLRDLLVRIKVNIRENFFSAIFMLKSANM